jgi:hypothetical protein
MSDQDPGQAVNPDAEAETHDEPDNQVAVQPIQGDQGPQVAEQVPADATGGNPDVPIRTSAPPPEAQSGVPGIPENEGVEPQPEFAGPVGEGITQAAPQDRPPNEQTTHPASPSE